VNRLACTLCLMAGTAFGSFATVGASKLTQPSVYGDARYANDQRVTNLTNVLFPVSLPPGRHQAFTVVAWLRAIDPLAGTFYAITQAFWCPDPQQKSNPDLLEGAGGHGSGGTNLTTLGGSITVASFPWQAYSQPEITNQWPKGIYTLDGWASNAVTVTLGGTDYVLGPGVFHRNAEPGVADSVVITGSGLASIGISRTPCYRYFEEVDGVTDGLIFDKATIVTNELVMCVWRFRVDGSNQIYRSDLGRMAAFNEISQVRTNVMSASGAFDSRGDYRVGLSGMKPHALDIDVFNSRVLPWWLSDAELDRIHNNGVSEINRRGIPQWR